MQIIDGGDVALAGLLGYNASEIGRVVYVLAAGVFVRDEALGLLLFVGHERSCMRAPLVRLRGLRPPAAQRALPRLRALPLVRASVGISQPPEIRRGPSRHG